MKNTFFCPFCGSEHVTNNGFNYDYATVSYTCNECGEIFNDGDLMFCDECGEQIFRGDECISDDGDLLCHDCYSAIEDKEDEE